MPQKKAIVRQTVVVASALVLLVTTPAEADQTFICNDGTSVTVAFEELTEMKETNSCVASYFKKTLSKAIKKKPELTKIETRKADVELRPTKQVKRKRKTNTAHAQLVISPYNSERDVPPAAAANTDYRNVHILNARPGDPEIFEHRR